MLTVKITGVLVNAKFDMSLPSSYITPQLASILPSLNAIPVSIVVGNDALQFSCAVSFSVFEKLMSDCIFGVDFFCSCW
jgi:hypothetical protein